MTSTAPAPSPDARAAGPSLGYMPALDGLRALAVVVVVLYHGDVGFVPGGFLGVEVFFVISGYLITALLMAERARTGGTDYLDFWLRRARRLLPALFAVLAAVATFWVLFHRGEVATIRGDIVAAFGYVTNWYQIVVQQSYFEVMGRPSPLRHLWSLAVEEQFYLVWPLALAGLYRLTRGRAGRMAAITLALAAASAVWAVSLYEPGTDPSRVYYGTDTRAAGVLLGAVLALLVPPWRMRPTRGPGGARAVAGIGLVGVAGIVAMVLLVDEYDPFLYQGGFVVLDVLTLAAILALVHPCRTLWSRAFGVSPMVWIGKRSYGIYLWHWPIFVLTRPDVDVPLSGLPLLVVRLALTVGIAELSYRFVEMPVRNGALGRWWAARRSDAPSPGRVRRSALLGGVAALVVTSLVITARPAPPHLEGVDLTGVVTDELGNVIEDGAEPVATTVAPPTTPAPTTAPPTTAPVATTAPPTTAPPPPPAPPPGIGASTIAIGDSVLLGARSSVRAALPGVTINAEVGRQFNVLPGLVAALADAGALPPNVVIHLGTNGPPTEGDLARVLDRLAGSNRVVLVTTKEARPWEQVTNERLAAAAAGRPNVRLADWYGLASGRPDFFVSDGVHLSTAGTQAYAAMIAAALA